jgi:hypothetical protein
MNRPHRQEEFEIVVDGNGSFGIPETVAKRLQPGMHFIVRMAEGKLHPALHRRGITEDEIEHIARVQLEPREYVIRFLESEGALAGNSSIARTLRKRMGQAR